MRDHARARNPEARAARDRARRSRRARSADRRASARRASNPTRCAGSPRCCRVIRRSPRTSPRACSSRTRRRSGSSCAAISDLCSSPQALAYRVGTDCAVDRLLLAGAAREAAAIAGWNAPRLPIGGGDADRARPAGRPDRRPDAAGDRGSLGRGRISDRRRFDESSASRWRRREHVPRLRSNAITLRQFLVDPAGGIGDAFLAAARSARSRRRKYSWLSEFRSDVASTLRG